jgi:hypothetical protein
VLKVFLAVAAGTKHRVHQLDFVGTFPQSHAIDRTVTMLPIEWKELFPEHADWFGIPLLCAKSICGGSCADLLTFISLNGSRTINPSWFVVHPPKVPSSLAAMAMNS